MTATKKPSSLGVGILVGAAVGAVAGLFLAPKAGKELRKDAKKLYEGVTKDPEAAVKEIFGKVSKETLELYKGAQKEVIAQLNKVSDSYKDLDSAKYKDIAMKAVEKVKDDHEVPQDQLKKLTAYLEGDLKKFVSGVTKKATTKKAVAKKAVAKKTS